MKSSETVPSRSVSLIASAAVWTAALLIAGLIGALWFVLAARSAQSELSAATIVATTAIVGVGWQRSRVCANRRLAALDAYADREFSRVKWSTTP